MRKIAETPEQIRKSLARNFSNPAIRDAEYARLQRMSALRSVTYPPRRRGVVSEQDIQDMHKRLKERSSTGTWGDVPSGNMNDTVPGKVRNAASGSLPAKKPYMRSSTHLAKPPSRLKTISTSVFNALAGIVRKRAA